MDYSLQDKYDLIEKEALAARSCNPVEIAEHIMSKPFVSIHGPEHHFLDGAAFLAAYKNAGGDIDLEQALQKLAERSLKMPGAMCGYWGVCGAVASVGAALSVIHGTGPLSTHEFYKHHMQYAADVLHRMSEIGGARCCKRNAFLALSMAADFVREKYGVDIKCDNVKCKFSSQNKQCLGVKCPFFASTHLFYPE